jgi:hypothetical protein
MAVFSDHIVDVYYSNPELTTVEILYEADKEQKKAGMELVCHHLVVDEEDDQFKDLLSEWSYEQIDESTKARNEQTRDEFRMAFHNYAMENDLYGHGNADTNKALLDHSVLKSEGRTDPDLVQGSLNMLFDFDPEDEVQKEDLFKLKLKMFEQSQVEDSKKQKLKADLRKSTTPIEAVFAYSKF